MGYLPYKLSRFFYRGGNWNNTSNAGVFYANGNNPRSNVNTNIGFRVALPGLAPSTFLKGNYTRTGKGVSIPSERTKIKFKTDTV